MLNRNQIIIGVVILVVAALFINLYSVQQRQVLQPEAQVSGNIGDGDITQRCQAIGGSIPTQPGQCPPGSVPVIIDGSPSGSQLSPTQDPFSRGGDTGNGIGDGDGNNPGDQIITPTGSSGICCVPVGTNTPTTCPIPSDPIPQADCSNNNQCSFVVNSVNADGAGTVLVRSLWSSGTFDFDANDVMNLGPLDTSTNVETNRLQLIEFQYQQIGSFDIQLECTDGDGLVTGDTCTQTVNILPSACFTPTPSPTTPQPTGTPTITATPVPQTPTVTPACFLPIPRLEFECPGGCGKITPTLSS